MFPQQVTTGIYLDDVLYVVAAMAVVIAVVGLGFIDAGLARRKNLLDTWVQKLAAGLVAMFAFCFFGYAIWDWQFNQAFGVPSAFWTAIKQWWLGGIAQTHFSQQLSPSIFPQADETQVFLVFFLTFAMFIGALIQSSGLERMKPWGIYILVFFIVLVPWSFETYLFWGSTSPLTNAGVHDYVGIFNGYLFIGTVSIVMNSILGPRLGAFSPAPDGRAPAPHDWGQTFIGVLLLLFAIPFIVLGSGYLVPGSGYFGISMTTSGFGLVFINVFMAYIGGGLAGIFLMYRTRNPLWILFGPLAGYISCSASFDISKPWIMLLVSIGGPFAAFGTYTMLRRLKIDDPKVGPLTFGPAIYGAIMAGLVGWGVKTGGYFGLKGSFGFQHASINVGWQLVGIVVTIGIAGVSTALITVLLKRANALRISEAQELAGLDQSFWGIEAYEPASQPVAVPAPSPEAPSPAAASAEAPPAASVTPERTP
jgi:ammonium transporter, Amt family